MICPLIGKEIPIKYRNLREALQNIDYHKLNDLLDEEAYYDNMKKTTFIYQQMQIFKELR